MTEATANRIAVALERIADAMAPLEPQTAAPVGSCPFCQAPEAKQVDASSIAAPHVKKCLVCGREYPG